MSEYHIASQSAPPPPTVPTSFVTDSGTVIPALNIVNINGGSSSIDFASGIQVIANPDLSNNEVVRLTNRISGTTTTSGAVTSDVITFSMGSTPCTITIDINISAFESTTPAGAGYSIFGTVRSNGTTAFLVGTPDKINNEDAALVTANSDIVVSGNNAIIRVTGVALLSLDWNAVGYYVRAT